jgi:DNA-binding transcriptional MerR regulator
VTYAIAEAAQLSGLSIDTLRYYERIELIDPPARDSGGRRAYSEEDLAWLEFLTKLRTTGMPIRLMREYAKLRHQGLATAGHRRQILVEHRKDVLARIADLQACLEVLNYKISHYEQCERELATASAPLEEATA